MENVFMIINAKYYEASRSYNITKKIKLLYKILNNWIAEWMILI